MKSLWKTIISECGRECYEGVGEVTSATQTCNTEKWCLKVVQRQGWISQYLIIYSYIITYIISTHVTPFPLEMWPKWSSAVHSPSWYQAG